MKIKHTMKVAMLSVLTTMGGGILFTSCEDMFTTDNGLVTDDLSPKDTVYTMMGIVKNMQRIMDRTVIFGELRADLVDVSVNTPSDLRDIANHTVGTDNAYNDPRDFYNVINSCNVYLANVDANRMASHSTDESYGEAYFEKEIIATKCYRAWTYLELAKIYGAENIPFITEPSVTADAAERMVADTSNRTNMVDLCSFFIDDIKSYANQQWDNEDLQPDYSVTFKSGQESNVEVSYRKFFIPVRLMLAELYLWRGSYTQNVNDYREAVRYYHEYLTHSSKNTNNVMPSSRTTWSNKTSSVKYALFTTTYFNLFRLGGKGNVAIIPMDTTTYYGNTSSIREVFSSKYSNNYYPAATPSQHLREIFQAQDYFYFDSVSVSDVTREYAPKTESQLRTMWEGYWWAVVGDLRFASIYNMGSNPAAVNNANFNDELVFNMKWEGGTKGTTTDQRPEFIPLFRLPIVYLHMAEALNRAGFPESAFVILKYGISTSALYAYAPSEFDALAAITSISSQDGDFTQWNVNDFVTKDMVSFAEYQKGSFSQWPIHAMGCGESWYDDLYTIGVNAKDVKYAVGDEPVLLDENGDPILDNDGNPQKAYGFMKANYKVVSNNVVSYPVREAWTVDDEPVAPEALPDYDTWVAQTYTAEELETMTEKKLQDAYAKAQDDYQKACDAYTAELGYRNDQIAACAHNRALKANIAADQQVAVADLVLTEEALEGMFEGTRWADLMRYSKQIGNDAFLGQTVAKRKGASTPDGALSGKLSSESGWYVTMPRR